MGSKSTATTSDVVQGHDMLMESMSLNEVEDIGSSTITGSFYDVDTNRSVCVQDTEEYYQHDDDITSLVSLDSFYAH